MVHVCYNHLGYYIRFKGKEFKNDARIAEAIGMPLGEYLAILKNYYNASILTIKNEYYGAAYFKKSEDVHKVADWINSQLVMVMLMKNNLEESL